MEQLEAHGSLTIGDSPIAARRFIPRLYEHLEFKLAWTKPGMVEQLIEGVRNSYRHGLTPRDFHIEALESRLGSGDWRSADPAAAADLDILFTDALTRLVFILHYGKLDPQKLDPVWNLSREFHLEDPVGVMSEVLESGKIAEFISEAQPQGEFYTNLIDALERFRGIADEGGWPQIPSGPILKPGADDPRTATLRQRLLISGDFQGTPSDSDRYDEAVEAAVTRFQLRRGIEVDGKVGPETLEQLNMPVEALIDKIRCSLERARWVFRDIEESFIVVNIAGFELYLVRDGEFIWETPVQVGKPYHATPVFKSTMKYLVLNPTWTIPPGILRNETLPKVRNDPEYLSKQNMSVVTSSGEVVDPSTIDWNAPFRDSIRQEPGPHNALGRVKFIFPNRFYVYLHDTPSKGLFAKSQRAFSHGCIRTQDPLRLAELLLEDADGWDRAKIDRTIAGGKTTTVMLPDPLTVMLLYWTAVAQDDEMLFFNDVYERDAAILEGLDAPPEFVTPAGAVEALGR
jgi:murein L,D-transpeptidase YcbB/YkuD